MFKAFKTNMIYIVSVVKAKILHRKETGGPLFEMSFIEYKLLECIR